MLAIELHTPIATSSRAPRVGVDAVKLPVRAAEADISFVLAAAGPEDANRSRLAVDVLAKAREDVEEMVRAVVRNELLDGDGGPFGIARARHHQRQD